MFQDKRIVALIPARGGSKGIKNKNIRPLAGKPLIAHTVEYAAASGYIDDVVVSTDSEEIANVAKAYGALVPFLRPAALASDTARTIDAVVHAIQTLRTMGRTYDALVLLQPTSPLRTDEDIDRAIEAFYGRGGACLASVSAVSDHPLLIRSIDAEGNLVHLLDANSTCRRQDMPSFYRINGAIYIFRIDDIDADTSFNDAAIPYVMTEERSVDIDTIGDFEYAEWLLSRRP